MTAAKPAPRAPRHMIALVAGPEAEIYAYAFWCPGCDEMHPFHVNPKYAASPWSFDGNFDAPTFNPSLRVLGRGKRGDSDATRTSCHLFLHGGQLKFCPDSPHALAGQTVPLPPFPDDLMSPA